MHGHAGMDSTTALRDKANVTEIINEEAGARRFDVEKASMRFLMGLKEEKCNPGFKKEPMHNK